MKQHLLSLDDIDCLQLVAGVDEAGRGPLAGPVIAAAVILNPSKSIDGLTDSKQLSEGRREVLCAEIKQHALAWAVGRAEVEEIDSLNILQATLLAMQRAVAGLSVKPKHILVDGNQCPKFSCAANAIVKGDLLVPAISAASIIAKVSRDHEMVGLEGQYPGYGFEEHKGYGTKKHMLALQRLGVSPIHRRSFGPVKKLLSVDVS